MAARSRPRRRPDPDITEKSAMANPVSKNNTDYTEKQIKSQITRKEFLALRAIDLSGLARSAITYFPCNLWLRFFSV